MMSRHSNAIKIVLWILAFEFVGFLLGLLTQSQIDPWYNGLHQSSFTPPPFVFSVVWPLLYIILAFVAALFWEKRHHQEIRVASYCFGVQLLMNWMWTPLFFYMHWTGLSFFWILILVCLTFIVISLMKDHVRKISLLLTPYLLWLIFAAYLNGVIWLLN